MNENTFELPAELDVLTVKNSLDEMLELQNDGKDYNFLLLCWKVRWNKERDTFEAILAWFEENGFIVTAGNEKQIHITQENYLAFYARHYPFRIPMTPERADRYKWKEQHYSKLVEVDFDYLKLYEPSPRYDWEKVKISPALLKDAIDCFKKAGYASTALLKRTLHIGYKKADPILQWLEDKKYISQFNGNLKRKVLITDEQYEEFIQENFGDRAKKN